MYPNYFGLSESGFSITPDPQYFFLSAQHQEALAHLEYGANEGGGFVLLTGEVGTGKTTVCRAFLERLPDPVDLALIFNPPRDGDELLQAICAEFRLAPLGERRSPQRLLDELNRYLLQAHAAGSRPVLLMDEAQNLSPEVLERVRLLTNLETDKHKLLQIFLVGQPELRDLLAQPGLRQLAQRITARFHLTPLGRGETLAYVRHRLRVAGAGRELFTPAALRLVHRRSGGVPRMINILCDRALLGAYATGRAIVTRPIVRRAARELSGEGRHGRRRAVALPWNGLLFGGLFCLTAAGAYWYGTRNAGHSVLAGAVSVPLTGHLSTAPQAMDIQVVRLDAALQRENGPAPEAAIQNIRRAPPVISPPSVEAPSDRSLPVRPARITGAFEAQITDRRQAMQRLLRRWGVAYNVDDPDAPCAVAVAAGLECLSLDGGLIGLKRYDRPALLPIQGVGEQPGYLVLTGIGLDGMQIDLGESEGLVSIESVTRYWDGTFVLLWRLPPGQQRVVSYRSPEDVKAWLEGRLAELDPGGEGLILGHRIRRFQRRQGLVVDGLAGPETLMRLNGLDQAAKVPRLWAENF